MLAIRAPFSVLGGVLFSVAIFLGLWRLVDVPMIVAEKASVVRPEFTRQRFDTPAEPTRPAKPVRELPDLTLIEPTGPIVIAGPITTVRPEPTEPTRPARKGLPIGVDKDATPLVRFNPQYPPRAAQNNIQGWVQVQFTVTAAGTVRDAVVVASEPAEVFDEAALEAVARWRYNPRVDGGLAVERVGLQTVFRFELEN